MKRCSNHGPLRCRPNPPRWKAIAWIIGMGLATIDLARNQQVMGADDPPAADRSAEAGLTDLDSRHAYVGRSIAGWQLWIHRKLLSEQPAETERAIELLEQQLAEIAEKIPEMPLAQLRKVELWFSPEYQGFGPRAEYHPAVEWLREHGRNPALARGIEFTNVRIFPDEVRRMPNFALHELAHAYHDQVLGFDEPRIAAAFERAKAAGIYQRVAIRDADGTIHYGTSYAMTDPQEYFAECTEAYYARNDIFPFDRSELVAHDQMIAALLPVLWGDRSLPNVPTPGSDGQ
jgi:dipeptidyl-peptidase-4